MRRLGHVFEDVANYQTLARAFFAVAKGKRWRADVREYAQDLPCNLSRLSQRLLAGQFRFGSYRYFRIYDPKDREIAVPQIEERIVHHAIIAVAGARMESALIDKTFACRAGRGQWKAVAAAHDLARRHEWCLKLDVKGYFDHIDHDVLLSQLARKFKDARLLLLLSDLVRSYDSGISEDGEARGLPIGNLTSQYFANLYLDPIDRWLDDRQVAHVRYMDDIIVFGAHDELVSVFHDAPAFLKDHLHLSFNDKGGLHRSSRGFDFLGCRVSTSGVRLSSNSRRRFLRKLRYYSSLEGWCDELWLQRRETSLFAFVRQVNSFGFRRKAVEECGRRVQSRPSWRRLQQQQRVCAELPVGVALLQQFVQWQQQQRLLWFPSGRLPCSSVHNETNQNSLRSCSRCVSGQIVHPHVRALVGMSPNATECAFPGKILRRVAFMRQFAAVCMIGLMAVSARGEYSTLPIESGEADSPAVRYDARTTHSSKLVRGTVTIGDADGGEPMAWDTSALSDGWNKVAKGGHEDDLVVLNNPNVAIEGGRLGQNAEWTADKTHLIRNTVYVPSGRTLTVSQGSVVKFCAGTGIKIEDGGTLNVVGAEGADVIFTAANDDTVGERIVGLPEGVITHNGVWKQTSSATLTDNNCVQMRGMSFGDYSTVYLNDSTAFRSSGNALIPVTLGGANRPKPFSVDWVAKDASAKFGEDYELASGRIAWNQYNEGTKTITIPLVKEHVVGSNTTFTVEIVTNRAVNVGRQVCTVTVKEWDAIDFQVATQESACVRFDTRKSAPGRTVHGVEKITGGGNDDETAVENWNTATLEDGWTTLTRSTNSLDVLAVNAETIAIEGGRIAANTTWTSDKTHLLRNTVYIPSGKTLTITTNAVVKFMTGTGIKIEDGGKLNVVGSADGDVIFTAANDDAAGIVIPGLGEEPITHKGFWKQSSSATFTDNGCIQTRNWATGLYPEMRLNDTTSFRPDGMAYVSVTISGSRDQPLSVEWKTIDGTAKYGEDFTQNAGRVSWNKASEGTKIIQIPLVKEHVVGKTTSFEVEIVVNRGVNVSRRICTVEIRERDALALEAAEATSSPVRFESRKTFPGLLNTGVVALGSPDGQPATMWDTRTEDNGWVTVTSGETNAELAVINDAAISIEGGRLMANATWSSNVTHLVRNTVYVPNGVTLTLSEGTVVKYLEGTTIKIEDGGKLNVVGAAGNDVVLTAANDDTVGAEIPLVDKTKPISFSGITKMSSGTYTDNMYVQTRGFAYGNYPTLTIHDAVVNRVNGKVYLPVTVGGTTRNQPFNVDWEVVPGTATYGADYKTQSGTLAWTKSGDGTKQIVVELNDSQMSDERRRFNVRLAAVRGASVADGEAEVTIHEYSDCGVKADVALFESPESADFSVREVIRTQPIFLNEVEPVRYSGLWQTFDASEAAKLRVSIENDNGVRVLKEASVDETGEFAFRPEDYPVGHYTLKHEIVDKVGDPLATMSKTFSVVECEDVEMHGGTLTSNEIWKAGMTHVVYAAVTVPAVYTLFIEPGAIVKFMTGTGIDISQGGALFANAIIFTHIDDDTVGGDTLSDGYTVAPPMDAYYLTGNFTFGDDAELRNITQKTALTGTLNGNKMLSKGSTYRVSGTFTIANGAKLTIPAGTVLKMEKGASIVVNAGGSLAAKGTRAAPIVITSINDDEYSGATTGSTHFPQPGDWHQINVAGGDLVATYMDMLYCSAKNNQGGLYVTRGTVSLNCCRIMHCMYDCMRSTGGNSACTNCVFADASIGVAPNGGPATYVNCVFNGLTTAVRWPSGTFMNCIFSDVATTFFDSVGSARISNSILWNSSGYGPQADSHAGQSGNIWADPLFIDPVNGDFRIVEGSPCVDAADSAAAPELDFYGQPRITLTEQTNDVPVVQGQLADIGICEVMPRDVTSDIDLQPVSVRAEEKATPGQLIFVKWTVSNVGGVEVDGSWRDTISLVSENGQQVTLGDKITTSHIAVGGEVFCSAYFTVPAMAEGKWRLKVNVNSYHDIFEGSLFANNALTSDRTVEISLPSIDPAQGATDGVINAGVPKVLKLTFAEGEENRMVHLDVPAGVKVTYGFGFMPRGNSASGSVIASDTGVRFRVPEGETDVYITMESETNARFEILREATKVSIESLTPDRVIADSKIFMEVKGGGFLSVTNVVLRKDGVRVEGNVTIESDNLVRYVRTTLPAGRYELHLEGDGIDVCVHDAVVSETRPAMKMNISTKFEFPESTRQQRVFSGVIRYMNLNDCEAPVPVYRLDGSASGMLFSLTNDPESFTNVLYVVGVASEHPRGYLKPGASGMLTVYCKVTSDYAYEWRLLGQGDEPRQSVYGSWRTFAVALADAATRLNACCRTCAYETIYEDAMMAGYGQDVSVLAGCLVDDGTSEPLAGVRLKVVDAEAVCVLNEVTTDENGFFTVRNLPGGKFCSFVSDEVWIDRSTMFLPNEEGLSIGNVNARRPISIACEVNYPRDVIVPQTDICLKDSFGNNIPTDQIVKDGEYLVVAETDAAYVQSEDVKVVVQGGVPSTGEVSVAMIDAGMLTLEVKDDKLRTGVPGVKCTLMSQTGVRRHVQSGEDGLITIKLPVGSYAVTCGGGYSLVATPPRCEIVKGESLRLTLEVSRAPIVCGNVYGNETLTTAVIVDPDFVRDDCEYAWDFDQDGTIDAQGVIVTNEFVGVGCHSIDLYEISESGSRVKYTKQNAVRIFHANEVELNLAACVLDETSGYEVVSVNDGTITLSRNTEMDCAFLAVGMTVILSEDALTPYEVVGIETDGEICRLTCKPTALTSAYKTFRLSSVSHGSSESCKVGTGKLFEMPVKIDLSEIPRKDRDGSTKSGFYGELDLRPGLNYVFAVDLTNDRLNDIYFAIEGVIDGELSVGVQYTEESSKIKKTWQKGPGSKKRWELAWTPKPIPVGCVPFQFEVKAITELTIKGYAKIPFQVRTHMGYEWCRYSGFLGELSSDFDASFVSSLNQITINGEIDGEAGVEVSAAAGATIKAGKLVNPDKAEFSVKAAEVEGELKFKMVTGIELNDEAKPDRLWYDFSLVPKISFTPFKANVGDWFNIEVGKVETDWRGLELMKGEFLSPMPCFRASSAATDVGQTTLSLARLTDLGAWEPIAATFFVAGTKYNAIDQSKIDIPFNVAPDDELKVRVGLMEEMHLLGFGRTKYTEQELMINGPGCCCQADCKCGRLCAPGTCQCGGGGGGGGSGGGIIPHSCDPNEMAGPLGKGDPETERFVKPGEWMTYTVYFENKSDATAAAQEVTVTNPLSEWLDWSTFEMGEVAFNNQIDLGLVGKKNGTSEVTMNGTNYVVRTELRLDEKTGVADWYMRIVDPTTDTSWPEDVFAGFLPPNDATYRGEGHLTYRIKVREDAPKGVRIDNSATIVFDYNDPITTDPAWWNTVGRPGPDAPWPVDEAFSAVAATAYDGILCDEDGNFVGVVQVKTAKQSVKTTTDKKTKAVTVTTNVTATATVTDANGKKWSYSKGSATVDGVVTGLKCTAKGCPVAEFGVMLGKNGMAGEWGECAIFGARNGMDAKGDAMTAALEAYKGKWSVAIGTLRLQLDVQAKGVVKVAGNWETGEKASATAQLVMCDGFAYVPLTVKSTKTTPAVMALLRISADGAVALLGAADPARPESALVAGGRTAKELGDVAYWQSEVSMGGAAFSARVAVDELAYPAKFAAKGLPAGLKIDAATGVISGTPTKPGIYTATVTVTSGADSKIKETIEVAFEIANYVDENIPVEDAYGPYHVGVAASEQIAAGEGCTVSGLPAGLKWAAKDVLDPKTKAVLTAANTVYGVPTKACTNTVYFKKSVKETVGGKTKTVAHVASATFRVEGMKPWAVGSFNGGGADGVAQLTVGGTGKISGKWMVGGTNWTLSAASFDAYDAERNAYRAALEAKSGKVSFGVGIEVSETGVAGTVAGDGGDPLFSAWRNAWKEEPWKTRAANLKGRKTTVEVGDSGVVELSVGANGAVTAKGSFVTGRQEKKVNGGTVWIDVVHSASCSTVLVPCDAEETGFCVYLYFPPKVGKFGGFAGVATWTP